jgi:hypothetical protein
MVRYTGNDDPTAAEGFNGLRTKDKIIRKTHMGTQYTHQTIWKKWEILFWFSTYIWAVAEVIFVGGPLIIYPVGALTPLVIGSTLEKRLNN